MLERVGQVPLPRVVGRLLDVVIRLEQVMLIDVMERHMTKRIHSVNSEIGMMVIYTWQTFILYTYFLTSQKQPRHFWMSIAHSRTSSIDYASHGILWHIFHNWIPDRIWHHNTEMFGLFLVSVQAAVIPWSHLPDESKLLY